LDTLKGGEAVQVVVKRKDEMKTFKVTLGSAPKDRGDFQNAMGSQKYTLSERRTGFGEVLQTDMVIAAKDCGGPVVDLEGNVLGINIARAGRVETWVLPSEVIRPLLPQYKAGKHHRPRRKSRPVVFRLPSSAPIGRGSCGTTAS
jgi:serine protease Do